MDVASAERLVKPQPGMAMAVNHHLMAGFSPVG
jgi:hypothetical protein